MPGACTGPGAIAGGCAGGGCCPGAYGIVCGCPSGGGDAAGSSGGSDGCDSGGGGDGVCACACPSKPTSMAETAQHLIPSLSTIMGAMRWLLVVVALGGCGRFHIDPLRDDAPNDAPNATPICTSDADVCEVASSTTEFDTSQGTQGWFYGYWFVTSDANGFYEASDFLEFVWVGLWRPPDYQDTGPTFTWAYLLHWGGHPGATPTEKVPVRRWVSDVAGLAEAVVTHRKADTSCGDGTRALLYVDGVVKLSRDVAADDDTGFVDVVPIEIQIGSRIDLLLHPIDGEECDTTTSELIIRSR